MLHQTFRFRSWIILTNYFYYCLLAIWWFCSASSKPQDSHDASKASHTCVIWVSEGGDCMHNKKLHTVIWTDFQFCCQVSNAFFPQCHSEMSNPTAAVGQGVFVLSRRTSHGTALSKQINSSAVDSKGSSVVMLPRRLLRVHYAHDSQLSVWQMFLTILFAFVFLPEDW